MENRYQNSLASSAYRSWKNNFSEIPFEFGYGDKGFYGFDDPSLELISQKNESDGERETHSIDFFLDNILKITVVISHYFSHGVTEWTVWFENVSNKNSKPLSCMQTTLYFEGKYPTLKGILGDHVNQYSPYSIDLQNNIAEFSSDSGRATHVNFPYFNLEYGDMGAMLAIGWAGTWKARFECRDGVTKYSASSVNGINTYLKPGEKIRTALFVLAPYRERSEHFATNFWRDWFVRYNLPKADAKKTPIKPFSTCCLASDTGLPNSDGSISECHTTWRASLEKMISEGVKVDFRWMDAGWYIRPDMTSAIPFESGHDWWSSIGTWEFDPAKWPGETFLESTDFARANSMKTLLWFEPERVTDPENLAKNFGYDVSWAIRVEGEKAISNNIGDPDCLKWTTERICKTLKDNKVEMYREDNNCNAIKLWKHLDDAEGELRQGITECKFIAAHYKMWDDIIACTSSYGGCAFVDSCASGGGRNDLESMRRGVPLLRSDSDRTSTALRLSMTSSFCKWIPFCGANTKEKLSELAPTGYSDKYVWRASYLPSLNVDSQFVYDKEQNFDTLRFGLEEWKRVAPYLLRDFYTLTPWHKEKDTFGFTAFCYFDPIKKDGVILAFRQEKCSLERFTAALPFGNSEDKYELIDEDSGNKELVNDKLTLDFDTPKSAKLLWIKKI